MYHSKRIYTGGPAVTLVWNDEGTVGSAKSSIISAFLGYTSLSMLRETKRFDKKNAECFLIMKKRLLSKKTEYFESFGKTW